MNFLHGFSLVTSSTLVVFGIAFFNSVLLADALGPAQYGRLSLWATTLLLSSLVLGEWLTKGCTFIVGRQRARGAALAVAVAYSLLLGGLLLAASPIGLRLCTRLLPGVTATQVYLMAGLIALTVLEKGTLAILLGEERLTAYALLPIAFACAYFGGNVLLDWTVGLTVDRVLGVWLVAVGLSSVVGCWLLARGGLSSLDGVGRTCAQMLRIGARAEVALVLTFLLLKSDVYVITWFLGEEAVGVYRVATNFTDMMQRVPNVASVILFAKVVRGQGSARLSLRIGQTMALFAVGSALLLVVCGPTLLRVFFPRYPGAYLPLVWLLPGMLFMGIGSVFNARLIGEGYPPITIWAPAAALALNVGANLWLVPWLGLRGAALSTSLAYAVWGVLVTGYCLRRTGNGWSQILRPPPLGSILRSLSARPR